MTVMWLIRPTEATNENNKVRTRPARKTIDNILEVLKNETFCIIAKIAVFNCKLGAKQ